MTKTVTARTVDLPARASLLSNTAALYVLQAANYVIPLVTLPYLVRTLGIEAYGALAISYSIVFFMVLLVDSGFNSFAIRELSRADLDAKRLNEIYAANQWLRLLLALGCFVVLLLGIVPLVSEQLAPLLIASFLMVVGSLLFPTWLFQGLEVMHVTTVCSVTGRVVATAAIFLLVDGPEDVLVAAIAQSSATALSGLICLLFIIGRLRLTMFLSVARITEVSFRFFRHARSLWASEFCTTSMSNSPIFILSLFVPGDVVGIYAAIDKVVRAAIAAFQPLQKALFPRIAIAWRDKGADRKIRDTWTLRLILAALVCAIVLSLSAGMVLRILFGEELAGNGQILQLLSAWLFLVVTGSTLNQFWLLASGNHGLYSLVLIAGAFTQLVLTLGGTTAYGIYGMAGALVSAELLHLAYAGRAISIQLKGVMS